MSRSVKDLREIINISRLSLRDDDSPDLGNSSDRELVVQTPDGLAAQSSSDESNSDSGLGQPKSVQRRNSSGKSKQVQGKPPRNQLNRSNDVLRGLSAIDSLNTTDNELNVEELLSQLKEPFVEQCLERANAYVAEITAWVYEGDNFVNMSQFWLSQLSSKKKAELFRLEYNIALDELTGGFADAIAARSVDVHQISQLLSACFSEYSTKDLWKSQNAYIFLDYLDVLTNIRHESYRSLLSFVKLRTQSKAFAQWLLAIRAFLLLNVWRAIVFFYVTFCGQTKLVSQSAVLAGVDDRRKQSVWPDRTEAAIKLDYLDVLHYILRQQHFNPLRVDKEQRNLVFKAVSYNRPKLLSYLLTQVSPALEVNEPSSNGNSPLHACATIGSSSMAEQLIAFGANVNATNSLCDGATALHLAVMYGHDQLVKVLLDAGADVHLKMGSSTALDMAKEFHGCSSAVYRMVSDCRPNVSGQSKADMIID